MTKSPAEAVADITAQPIVLLGAGGHARVVLDALTACGGRLAAVVDPAAQIAPDFADIAQIAEDSALAARYAPGDCLLLNGLGVTPGENRRRELFERFVAAGYRFLTLVHPAAVVSPTARLGDGAQVMAGAVVQCDVHIGRNAIVNTRASVDHDSDVGDHVHIAPGAVLCGGVSVGAGAFVGAGAVLLPGAQVVPNELAPAGETRRAKRK